MNTIQYDFSRFDTIMFHIKSNPTKEHLIELKNELNKFFTDCTCKDIIYTENLDKLFFGMYVIPIVSGDDAMKILASNDKYRVIGYYIELDSKLFDGTMNLTSKELTASLLHEVGHLTNTSQPVDELRKATDTFLYSNNEHLILNSSKQYKELLAFAVKDSLRKLTSMFEFKRNEELIADEFVVRCGYGPDLESALKKISKNSLQLNKEVDNKLIVLQWTLRLYKDVRCRRIAALHTLNKGKQLTGSVLQKREIDTVINNLQQIDDDRLIVESVIDVISNINKSLGSLYRNFKYRGMKALEDDYYDLALRSKNVDDQEEALATLRQINLRLSILDEYLRTENLDPDEKQRWMDLMQKYNDLRDFISKKQTYTDKYYGLFVKTPVIKSRFD